MHACCWPVAAEGAPCRGYTGLGEYTLGREDQSRGDTKVQLGACPLLVVSRWQAWIPNPVPQETMAVWTPDLPADSEEAKLPFHGASALPLCVLHASRCSACLAPRHHVHADKWPDPRLAFRPVLTEYLAALSKLMDR